MLRYANGKGIVFSHYQLSTNGDVTLGIADIVENPGGEVSKNFTSVLYSTNANAMGVIPGYDRNNSTGHLFRLSCEGFDITLEFSTNSGASWITLITSQAGCLHMTPGRTAWFRGVQTEQGFSSYTTSQYQDKPLWSDDVRVGDGGYEEGYYDVRDARVREHVETVGSILNGSTILTLTSPMPGGLKTGDGIVVVRNTPIGTPSGVGGYQLGEVPSNSTVLYRTNLPDPETTPLDTIIYVLDDKTNYRRISFFAVMNRRYGLV